MNKLPEVENIYILMEIASFLTSKTQFVISSKYKKKGDKMQVLNFLGLE